MLTKNLKYVAIAAAILIFVRCGESSTETPTTENSSSNIEVAYSETAEKLLTKVDDPTTAACSWVFVHNIFLSKL